MPKLFLAASLLLTGTVVGLAQAPASPAASEIIAKIVAANGPAPIANTVDTIKAGDPATPVTGIATTFMDTMDVLRQAVAKGDNLVITHEPTFYNHLDDRSVLPGDPVTAEKLKYIEDHHLVVWRFHDGWHRHVPDGILTGMVAELGLGAAQQGGSNSSLFVLPQPTTVRTLAAMLQARTDAAAVRVVGNPEMPVTKVGVLLGAAGGTRQIAMLQNHAVQVLIVGEATEWETIPYAHDAAAQGRMKALILLGHDASEEAGMRYCAEWLHGVVPGIRTDFIPSGEAFSAVITRTSNK